MIPGRGGPLPRALLAAAILLASSARAQAPVQRGVRAAAAARRHLGRAWRGDCSTFVLSAWHAAGIRIRLGPGRSRSESLYRATRRVATPRPGDLAFFHHTYDRNGDGLPNDPFSHVAIVEAVDGAAVVLLHRSARGIERVRMDLGRPADARRNDPMRAPRGGESPAAQTLAGELFAGYGAVPGRGR